MAFVLIMPRQGNTVESCIITGWKVKEGDTVTSETTVCDVETDKAAFEVPAGNVGTVLKLLHAPGDDVPVLQPIAVIGAPGENWEALLENSSHRDAGDLRSAEQGEENSGTNNEQSTMIKEEQNSSFHPSDSSSLISPRARNLAENERSPVAFSGTGPGGRVIERDVISTLQNRPPLTAAAKAAASGALPAEGSGIGGRVTASDLVVASEPQRSHQTEAVPPLPAPHSPFPIEGAITETPIKGVRKIIADRMFESLAGSAQFTLNASAPAVKLQEIRSRIKAQGGFAEEQGLSKVTINDLVLFAVSRTLRRFPYMNAHKVGDTIRTFERVHIAVAVDTLRGLMVPVIRNADLLSLAQISSEAKRLAAACQNGTANPDELSGSTFTVSNLGTLGITSFTPVLNGPEVAILGLCCMEMKPVALREGETNGCDCGCNCGVRFEPQIGFSLTINHQAVDGAPAAKFLKALGEAVANIDLLLVAG